MAEGTGPSGQTTGAPPDRRHMVPGPDSSPQRGLAPHSFPLEPDEPAAPAEPESPLPPDDAALPPGGAPDDAALAGAPDEADEAPPASDAPVTVTTRLSPNPSSIGDLLTLEVTAAFPAGVRVNLPIGVDFAPLHLVSVEEGEPESTGQGFRKLFKVTLQHFQVGEAQVPAFPMTWVNADGQVATLKVAATPFTVDALLANEADPKRQGEDPPVSLEYPAERAELVIYSAAVAMLLGFLLALLWRRLRQRPELVIGPPPIPPHERALSALEALEGAGLLETGLYQDYYVELTEIAKGYLEGRFGVEALDRTTDEIRRELVRSGDKITPLQPDEVIRFLQECDLVKFARFAPEVDEARGALGKVRTMVEETKPVVKDMAKETGPSGPGGSASSEAATGTASTSAASSSATSTGAPSNAAGSSATSTGAAASNAASSSATSTDAAPSNAAGSSDAATGSPRGSSAVAPSAGPAEPARAPDPATPGDADLAAPGSKEGPR